MSLYEQLRDAGSDAERRAITTAVIEEMRVPPLGDPVANVEYFNMCAAVIGRLGHGAVHMSSSYGGEFPPVASAILAVTPARVSGFLGAIHRIPKVQSAIEAGPGAGALFSVAAAARGAQVIAGEMNEPAAECAEEVVKLTGFADRIKVTTGDILAGELPAGADIAVAEILGPGLRGEGGLAVLAGLKNHATHVIPDAAVLHAVDIPAFTPTRNDSWAKVANVDLTSPITRVSGEFLSTGAGDRRVWVYADIWSQGREIVAGVNASDLNLPIAVGSVTVPRPATPIEFAYDVGAPPYATPDYVGVCAA